MSGAEVFAGLGLLATELFRYNRENYQFDQDQRFEREELRLKMQLQRFSLFREDIRDLVLLTVGKMDLYHLVGALFLKGCCVYYCTGLWHAAAPTFLLALYYLSLSCSFVYLVLAIWLAMHASIASHSHGTRLLTRFIRLPIPGGRELDKLNARLSDFEKQDKQEMLRVPFVSARCNDWHQRRQLENQERAREMGTLAEEVNWDWSPAREARGPQPRESHAWPSVGKAALRAGMAAAEGGEEGRQRGRMESPRAGKAPAPSVYGAQRLARSASPRPAKDCAFQRALSPKEGFGLVRTTSAGSRLSLGSKHSASSGSAADWLESGEFCYGGHKDLGDNESEMLQAVELRTQRHVQLFRQLQAKWQSCDAYARVCMSLGVRQMIQAVTYFLIGVLMVENEMPMCAFTTTFTLQTLAVAISVLDIHGLPCYGNLDLSLVGMLPALVACASLCLAPRNSEGELKADHSYLLALAAYPLEICWFEILHSVAAPPHNQAALPSHFRSVLFMDVFGEVDDPTEADLVTGRKILSPEERVQVQMRISSAEGALVMAQAALRRWEAVPISWLSRAQLKRLRRCRRELNLWTQTLDWELELRRLPKICFQQQAQSWEQLSAVEREEDQFAGTLLGPFEHFTGAGLTGTFYYDLERDKFLYEMEGPRRILGLSQAAKAVRGFKRAAETVKKAAAGQLKLQGGQGGQRTFSFASSFVSSRPETAPTSPSGLVRNTSMSVSSTCSASPRCISARSLGQRSQQAKVKVPKLPWLLTSLLTRVLQFMWVCVGIMGAMKEFGICVVDTEYVNIVEGRRLEGSEVVPLRFELVEVAWPHSRFFRPESLARLPAAEGEEGGLLVGSPYALYRASSMDGLGFELKELPSEPLPPQRRAATPLCSAEAAKLSCLLAAPLPRGLALWRPEEGPETSEVLEAFAASPVWRLLAGAAVSCEAWTGAPWCLLLAAWAGGEELTIALVELPGGPTGPPPRHDALIFQRAVLPLAAPSADASNSAAVRPGLAALHVDPRSGRLWALWVDGGLEAWDLMPLPARRLGKWLPSWPLLAGSFHPTALCEDREGIFVTGRTWGKDQGPVLLWANLTASTSL